MIPPFRRCAALARLTDLRLAALAGLLCLPLCACSEASGSDSAAAARSTSGGRDTNRRTLVVVESLRTGPVRDEVVVSAKVAARTTVVIYPKLSGLAVTGLFKEEGDTVAEGEVLLTLFDTDLQLAEQTAKAALEEARGTLQRSQLTVEESKQRVKSAERSAQKAGDDVIPVLYVMVEGGLEALHARGERATVTW